MRRRSRWRPPAYYANTIAQYALSTTRDILAGTPAEGLLLEPIAVEKQMESELRRRTAGRHVEIASVVIEKARFAQEVEQTIRDQARSKTSSSPPCMR